MRTIRRRRCRRTRTPSSLVTTEWLAANLGRRPAWWSSSPTRTCCSTTPGTSRARSRSTGTPSSTTRSPATTSTRRAFAELCAAKGIGRDDTIVFYGDNFNWWAAYALWVFSLFGHRDVRLLDGGRQKWVAEGRELTREQTDARGPTTRCRCATTPQIRAFRDQVMAHIASGPAAGRRALARRSTPASSPHMAAYPQEGALRGGHIPGAVSKPWKSAANDDGTFKPADELRQDLPDELGLETGDDIIAYCRIGERSSHTWFVLHHLLGYPQVRNYDGSWTEWGNLVRAPIARGDEPGGVV